ncbi:MAG: hypothetical protein PVJ49_14695 [Acidobacteriota bacterium]|jgi:hypothetical protein
MTAKLLAGAAATFLLLPRPSAAWQAPTDQPAIGPPASTAFSATSSDIELEAALAADPVAQADWLRRMAVRLAGEGADLDAAQRHAAGVLRLRGERLARHDATWPDTQSDAFLALLLIDPRRFLYDGDFRASVAPVLVDGVSDRVPAQARRRMATRLAAFDFGLLERIKVAWGLVPRPSRTREVPFEAIGFDYGSQAPIRASIYSLPSRYFNVDEATRFLRSVHAITPQRRIVVLSNGALIDELRPLATEMPLVLLDSLGRRYSPWPRDPFFATVSARGPVTLVVRPNIQAQRELDVFMAREIVQDLPDDVDREWQHVQWTMAPVPFHGGHMLSTPTTTWVSAVTLLPRVKEILGTGDKIDLQALRDPQVLRSFLTALEMAGTEFQETFNQPVRFVHALPVGVGAEELDALQTVLGGGDARDLDSIITIVESAGEPVRALVGDVTLGSELIEDAPDSDIQRLRALYHLQPTVDELRQQLADGHRTSRNRQFDAFLDASAAYLQRLGLEVTRLPLLDVSQRLIPPELSDGRPSFLINWNNVVLEEVDGGVRAEGFASGMAVTDKKMREIYADAGVNLDYVAPLALSVLRDGGYRCASNHVR